MRNVVALLVCLSSVAYGDYASGLRSYQAGDYASAFAQWQPLAEHGDPKSQLELGVLYALGRGVPQDYAQAAVWYRRAADQGDAEARCGLGSLYEHGHGVQQDYGLAAVWYRRAADQGFAYAQEALGSLFELGRGVNKDYGQAADWYRRAADQGLDLAQDDLGMLYEYGLGVPQDARQAVGWYRKAADQGLDAAQFHLGVLYDLGQKVPQDFRQAAAWYRQAADQGLNTAEFDLGALYEHGQGVPRDYSQAVAWYQRAARQGLTAAQNSLGHCYVRALGVPQDYLKAAVWFVLAGPGDGQEDAVARSEAFRHLTPTQVAEANRLAQQWRETGSEFVTAPVVATSATPTTLPSVAQTPAVPRNSKVVAPLGSAQRAALTTAEIAKLVSKSVVVIQGKTDSGEVLGSGFLISKDGKIVTNLHVVRDMKTANVQLSNGYIFDSLAVLATDERRDLAMVQVAGFDLPVLDLGDSDSVAVGEPLVIVGSPRGLEGSVTAGILSSVRDMGDGFKVLQTDAAVNPGNSGGPLLNDRGQAVGVVSFKLLSSEGLNFAIPINYVQGLLGNVHLPMTLSQMRSTLSSPSVTQGDAGPTLKDTLDWLREKVPLGVVSWSDYSDDNKSRGTVRRQSQAWSLGSCTIVVGSVDVVILDRLSQNEFPFPQNKMVLTDRNTLSLSNLQSVFVVTKDNPLPGARFLGGDKASPNVVLVAASPFIHDRGISGADLAPWSEKVNEVDLPFADEQLANRVRDAFKHAGDLCRKKEAF